MKKEYEYSVLQKTEKSWEVLKFDMHHGAHVATYIVNKLREGDRQWWICNCPARVICKHIKMVKEQEK